MSLYINGNRYQLKYRVILNFYYIFANLFGNEIKKVVCIMNREKIDFVMPWVDGSDIEWQREKTRYRDKEVNQKEIDASMARYRDWDNLQYWFRGVEKFTPWVNKIHFITYGHLPKWLNTTNPKLQIVKHEDYIPEKYLPVFSARPIELNIHRIPGLSDKFVYFN